MFIKAEPIENDKCDSKRIKISHDDKENAFPNNAATHEDYRWWVNGENDVRCARGVDLLFPKIYYACSEKSKGCRAKKRVHEIPGGDVLTFQNPHNHPPPKKPPTKPEVKQGVISQLSVGAKPTAILRNLVNNADEPISRKNVPTKQQMYNWQHQLNIANLPTGNQHLSSFFLSFTGY
jgi:WRKY DNA -binding domain